MWNPKSLKKVGDGFMLVLYRVKQLQDSRRVVLTERVHEFLDWAQNFFEISVCSLG